MQIIKILNNNAIICKDLNNTEKIAMGKGIGFQQKVGNTILEKNIEKIFILNTEEMKSRFQQVVSEIPVEHILLTEKIISHAKKQFNIDLHDSIYVSLPDHISTALDRYNQNIILKNPLLNDIKRFYPDEYAMAIKALDFVEQETTIRFEDDEAGFIAMHFVNAELNTNMQDIYDITQIIDEITKIVKDFFNNKQDEQSFAWYRFLTHIKFFAQRLKAGEDYDDKEKKLFTMVNQTYPEAFNCVKKIIEHIKIEYNHEISKEEITYLTLHIQRLKNNNGNKGEY